MTGAAGQAGAKGDQGSTGATGPTGASGAVGPLTMRDRNDVLTALHDQIEHIYHELDIQLKRMAQIQAELDNVRATVRRLAGFAKLELAPGERRRVEVRLEPRLLAAYDPARRAWTIAAGEYRLYSGRSADDLDEPVSLRLPETVLPSMDANAPTVRADQRAGAARVPDRWPQTTGSS